LDDIKTLLQKSKHSLKTSPALLFEEGIECSLPTKLPNFEYSLKYKKVINLNKKEIEYLNKINRGEEKYVFKAINEDVNDFSFKKITDEPNLREEVGFVTRGGYS
jgi:hypothetical protein